MHSTLKPSSSVFSTCTSPFSYIQATFQQCLRRPLPPLLIQSHFTSLSSARSILLTSMQAHLSWWPTCLSTPHETSLSINSHHQMTMPTATDAYSQATNSTRVEIAVTSCTEEQVNEAQDKAEESKLQRQRSTSRIGTLDSTHAPTEKEIILVSAEEFSRTIVIILASVIPLTSVLQWNFKASQLRSSELAYFPTTFTRSSLFTQTYLPRMKNPLPPLPPPHSPL